MRSKRLIDRSRRECLRRSLSALLVPCLTLAACGHAQHPTTGVAPRPFPPGEPAERAATTTPQPSHTIIPAPVRAEVSTTRSMVLDTSAVIVVPRRNKEVARIGRHLAALLGAAVSG